MLETKFYVLNSRNKNVGIMVPGFYLNVIKKGPFGTHTH